MRKKKIYIAGPMSGIEGNNRFIFHAAAEFLRSDNIIILNPASLPIGLTEPEYMQICLSMLQCADEIYLLDGWEQSKGARSEKTLAEKLDLEIVYQNGVEFEMTLAQLSY
ncbi:DUF4406 domain-containing protein [Parashewanella curva]|uniref:DUF4406 domain-containing protein n=1 Tax=Parashewanella curva TaxID=2338552 RepID=A0A3L8Q036_9GAMM|nr:DUF4406 domain-containing protein [Parashewanella curva]RLV60994.1 DUF4406 domain-containing protein [Parashewanella curva]